MQNTERVKLRSDLSLGADELTGHAFVFDPITHRKIGLDEVQVEVWRALAEGRSPAQIAVEVLEDAEQLESVHSFIQKLTRLSLIDDGADQQTIRLNQAKEMKRAIASKHDSAIPWVVDWATTSVPFYRDFIGKELASQVKKAADLEKLPLMGKVEMRDNFPARMVPDGVEASELLEGGEVAVWATSGSTGQRLSVFYDLRRSVYPANFPGVWPIEGGWEKVRCALFTTPVCSGTVCHMGGMTREQRITPDNFYFTLNSSNRILGLTRSEIDDILGDMNWWKPNIMRVDPIYMMAFLRAVEREGLQIYKPQVLWTAYEYYSKLFQPVLKETFQCPIFTVYGVTDLGGGCQAFRCEHGIWHVREDQYRFEFLRGGKPVEPNQIGEITVTSFGSRFMNVIRYRVRDVGRPLDITCPCSHGEWKPFQLEARMKDCMLDTKGKEVITTKMFDDLFEGFSWIDMYAITQMSQTDYQMLAIRRPGKDTQPEEDRFIDRAKSLLGNDANIKVKYVREIPVDAAFKFQLTQSKIFDPDNFHKI